jgi:hypothetical protein
VAAPASLEARATVLTLFDYLKTFFGKLEKLAALIGYYANLAYIKGLYFRAIAEILKHGPGDIGSTGGNNFGATGPNIFVKKRHGRNPSFDYGPRLAWKPGGRLITFCQFGGLFV